MAWTAQNGGGIVSPEQLGAGSAAEEVPRGRASADFFSGPLWLFRFFFFSFFFFEDESDELVTAEDEPLEDEELGKEELVAADELDDESDSNRRSLDFFSETSGPSSRGGFG